MDYKLERSKARLEELCSGNIYPWLREVGEKFKAFGAFPLCLSDYYADPMDKQVAEVVGLLVPQTRRDTHIMKLRKILGDSPWEKVRQRNFMELTNNKLTMGFPFLNDSTLFNFLDWIWDVTCEDRVPLEYAILGELDIINRHHKTPLNDVFIHSDIKYRMEMLLVKMTLQDGYGTGLWQFLQEEDLPCPLNDEMRKILAIFYPVRGSIKDETIPDVLSFLGYEKRVDFLYSAWGYQYLRRHEKDAVKRFETKFKWWWESMRLRSNLPVNIPLDCLE